MANTATTLPGLSTILSSSNGETPPRSALRIWPRLALIASLVAMLPACNTSGKLVLASGSTAKVSSFVAADEPAAAGVGRDVLANGGSAMDAAAAMGMAMTATLPSRVGLAGGGVCVVFDSTNKTNKTLDFLPRGQGAAAVPLLTRGLYALQASGGKLRWEQVVAPAERLAARTPVSRAFANDVAAGKGRFDPAAMAIFAGAHEGAVITQPQLQSLLSDIRRLGLLPIHGAEGAEKLGHALGVSATAIRDAVPIWRDALSIEVGSANLNFADVPEAGGGALLLAAVKAAEDGPSDQQAARARSVIDAAAKGGDEAPAAGFVAVDADESAVACSLTLGAAFGSGHLASGTGLFPAVPVRSAGFGAPALQTYTGYGRTIFAVAASAAGGDGPLAAPRALLDVAIPVLVDGNPVDGVVQGRPAGAPGRVSVVACQSDSWGASRVCQPAADPKAPGAAFTTMGGL